MLRLGQNLVLSLDLLQNLRIMLADDDDAEFQVALGLPAFERFEDRGLTGHRAPFEDRAADQTPLSSA